MPILKPETDIFPANLLENAELLGDQARKWWSLYTLSRHEKELMRKLQARKLPFYGPIVPKRYRSPGGRMRTSYMPLFPNYVFFLGDEYQRLEIMQTNCISKYSAVNNGLELVTDLRQIHAAILAGVPLTPESRLEPGDPVRVRTGPFKGYEGRVLRREGKTRLLLAVRFLEQGVSMEVDEGVLEPV